MSNPATKNTKTTKPPKATIAAQIADLDAAVEWFYSEDFALDQALAHYEHAAKLADSIEHDLAELKNRIEVLEDFTN